MSASLQHNFNQDDLLFAQPECLRPSDTRMAKVFDARKQQQALAMRVTAEARLRDAAGTAAGLYHCGEQVLHPGKCQGALKIQSEESVALVWCSCCKQLLDSTDKNKRFYEQLNSANAALPLDYVLLHSFEDETFVLCDWAGEKKATELPREIHLAIRGLAGLLALVDVKASISIHELREKLEEQLGIPAEEQKLLLGTAPLSDCASLSTALGKTEDPRIWPFLASLPEIVALARLHQLNVLVFAVSASAIVLPHFQGATTLGVAASGCLRSQVSDWTGPCWRFECFREGQASASEQLQQIRESILSESASSFSRQMQALQGQLEEFLERTAHMERVENRRELKDTSREGLRARAADLSSLEAGFDTWRQRVDQVLLESEQKLNQEVESRMQASQDLGHPGAGLGAAWRGFHGF
eukprot:g2893.t1